MGAGSAGGWVGGGGTWAGNVSRNSSRQKLLSWTTPYVTQISNKVQKSTMKKKAAERRRVQSGGGGSWRGYLGR